MNRYNGLNVNAFWRVWGLTVLVALAVFVLTRAALLLHSVLVGQQAIGGLLGAFALGALRDLPAAAVVASPWVLFAILFNGKWGQRLRSPLFVIYVFTLLFVAVSEGFFWDEFSVRFNFIAVDYLIFTTEVIGNIRESYPIGKIIMALALLAGLIVFFLRIPLRRAAMANGRGRGQLVPGVVSVLLVWTVVIWMAAPEFSTNSYANELADNGWRSFLSAARQNRLNYRQFYATRPDAEVLSGLLRLSGSDRITATHQAVHKVSNKLSSQPNVVVVMMESMSAEFMQTFGNQQGLTPNLDRLAREGLFFSRMYATGTRTVRGLEALSAALPPLPGASVVRWPNLSNLNTLGSTLAARGWEPNFIYGGYGMFDNMNRYFDSQGYKVTDRKNFEEGLVRFENVWGVADEHLFDQVLIKMDRDIAAGKRLFAHVMTTSNHRPFTYPDGRIDIPSPAKREGGVKYADYAIGRFFEMAKTRPWFDNTVFVIVADHCASSAGKTKIPVFRYHIPAIIYAPKMIPAQRVDTLSSQIDLVPTILGLLGLESDNHFIGRDILRTPPEEGRALLATYQNLGYLKGEVMTVLSPKRKVESFRISADGREAQPTLTDPKLAEETIAYFQGAAMMLERHGDNGSKPVPFGGS